MTALRERQRRTVGHRWLFELVPDDEGRDPTNWPDRVPPSHRAVDPAAYRVGGVLGCG